MTSQSSSESENSVIINRNGATIYIQIANMLRERILRGEFKPGDPLPSERDLATSLNVSRIPVREAMKSLEYLGLVKYKRGIGVVVQTADLQNILQVCGPLVTSITPEVMKNLFDFRLLIEPYAAEQAALAATQEDLDGIAGVLQRHAQALEKNEPAEEISFEFHSRIMKACGNQVISTVSMFLSEIQYYSRQWTLWNKERRYAAFKDHQKIFNAIKKRDANLARQTMYSHLIEAKEVLPTVPAPTRKAKVKKE